MEQAYYTALEITKNRLRSTAIPTATLQSQKQQAPLISCPNPG